MNDQAWNQLKKSLAASTEDECTIAIESVLEYRPGPLTPQKLCGVDDDFFATDDNVFVRDYAELLRSLAPALTSRRALPAITQLFVLEGGCATLLQDSLVNLSILLENTRVPSTRTDHILAIVEALFDSDFIQSAVLYECSRTEPCLVWRDLLQQLISFPVKLANKFKNDLPTALSVKYFLRAFFRNILKSIKTLADAKRYSIERNFRLQPVATLLSKVLANFDCSAELKEIVASMNASCINEPSYRSIFPRILIALEGPAVINVAEAVFSQTSPTSVDLVLSDVVLKDTRWKHRICDTMLTKRFYKNDMILKNVAQYLKTDEVLLVETFCSLADVWGNAVALNRMSIDQRVYLSKAMILFAKAMSTSGVNVQNEIRRKLFSAVPIHLELTEEKLRAIGMIVTECILSRINASDCNINFEYDGLRADSKALVEQLRSLNEESHGNETPSSSDNLESLIRSYETSIPSANEPIGVTQKEKAQPESVAEEWDSDDELTPYDLSNDVAAVEVQRPKYLRDLIDGMLEKTNAAIWIGSVQACEELVKSQLAQDDPCVGIELLALLVTLEKQFHVENFDAIRYGAAVAIVNVYPQACAPYLCEQFHEPAGKYSISHRVFMLNVLAGSVRDLCSFHPDEVQQRDRNASIVENDWERVIRERIQMNTKYKSRSKPVLTKANNLNTCIGHFFYPLARGSCKVGAMSPQSMLKHVVGMDWHQLLVHYVDTLAIIMCCSVHCQAASKMALEFLELTKCLRSHTDTAVRTSVVRSVAAVLISVPKATLLNRDMLEEFVGVRRWLEELITFETDQSCSDLINHVLSLIRSVFN
jgi:hypothetical protein